mmetsp:Transcript_8796/g.22180  ORF Transcript_8796/g.22180 Transcript_8796/m.22180 type:complete len:213 (-) Transcript_8796:124-762(-)
MLQVLDQWKFRCQVEEVARRRDFCAFLVLHFERDLSGQLAPAWDLVLPLCMGDDCLRVSAGCSLHLERREFLRRGVFEELPEGRDRACKGHEAMVCVILDSVATGAGGADVRPSQHALNSWVCMRLSAALCRAVSRSDHRSRSSHLVGGESPFRRSLPDQRETLAPSLLHVLAFPVCIAHSLVARHQFGLVRSGLHKLERRTHFGGKRAAIQ